MKSLLAHKHTNDIILAEAKQYVLIDNLARRRTKHKPDLYVIIKIFQAMYKNQTIAP